MKIGGYQKFSLIDYPGKLSAVIFTQGCNMLCPYCHNPELVEPHLFIEPIAVDQIISFLKSRLDHLNGVVVTGGEPTIQPDLTGFLAEINQMGYQIKLDTNGSRPDVLRSLIDQKMVNFLAMDIKAPWKRYQEITGSNIDPDTVKKSVELIKSSQVDYEFRTTIVAEQLSREDIFSMADSIRGARKYVLQQFKPSNKLLGRRFNRCGTYPKSELESWAKELTGRDVDKCLVR